MEPTPTLFRWLLVGGFVLAVFGSFTDTIFPSLLPQVLLDAQEVLAESDAEAGNVLWGVTLIVTGILMLVLIVASYMGLYLFKSWGRRLAVWTTAVALPFYLLIGPVVQSGLSTLLLESSMIVWGAILAMAYFSPLKNRFEIPANSAVLPPPAGGAADCKG